jgi:hypothetical protein
MTAPPESAALADVPAPPDLFCAECGYDLRGSEHADRCPECGTVIDRSRAAAQSRIPWDHRATLGRLRAYRRTFWLAVLRPKRLGAEAARPVSYRSARRFRVVTALVAGLPPAGLLVATMVLLGGTGFLGVVQYNPFPGPRATSGLSIAYDLLIPWEAGATLPPVMPIGILLFTVLASGVAGYWFHPGSLPVVRQNRAVALAQYACAPLVWLWVPLAAIAACEAAVVVLATAGLGRRDVPIGEGVVTAVEQVSVLAALLVLLAWWRATLSLLRASTHAGAGRMVSAAVFIPLAWAACGVLALIVFPWVVGYVSLIVGSLS